MPDAFPDFGAMDKGRSYETGDRQAGTGRAWMWANNPRHAYSQGYGGFTRPPGVMSIFFNAGGSWVSKPLKPRKEITAEPAPNKTLSTYALNAGQALAGFGNSIPILFGKYTGTSGGFVTAPSAIYQRMHSQGVFEWCRTAFVIGEGGVVLNPADERGVRTGTKSLSLGNDLYWSYLFTDGATANNDPRLDNTIGFGQFKALEDVTPANQFLGGTISGGEVRCFSQTFDGGEAFGFSGEDQECDQFGDSGGGAPGQTSQIQPLNLNIVRATISNTRTVKVTEIGLAVNLRTNFTPSNDTAPAGSLWTFVDPLRNSGFVFRILSIAGEFSRTYSYKERKDSSNAEANARLYGVSQKAWDEGRRPVQVLDSRLRPVTAAPRTWPTFKVEDIGTRWIPYTGSNRNRNATPATGFAMDAPDPCAPMDYIALLSDPLSPKMMFRIFWRSFSSTGNSWRELTRRPLIAACMDSTTMFTKLKIQHPTESAAEFRFEPIRPDEVASTFVNYTSGSEGYSAESDGDFPIIYERNSPPIQLDLNDDYKLEFNGGLSEFYNFVDIDSQTPNYAVGISYVNEILPDAPEYPLMATAVLNTRGYKNMSAQGALSVYYDNGAQIRLLETGVDGTSNMFPELANYLLTTFPGGTGAVTSAEIDIPSFTKAIAFTRTAQLFFDGVIENKSGAFEFISAYAPYFLLNFGTVQGKYAFSIATQDSSTGTSTAIASQKLTLDDIVADSYQVEYSTLQDRQEAIVNVTYRFQEQYLSGEPRTVSVSPAAYTGSNIISIDLSDFCTTETHAITYAKFVLATRLTRTHTVSFTTFLDRIDLSPGRLFTFDFTVMASTGKTYENTNQYQIVSAFYRADGLVNIEAIETPVNLATLVFGDTYKVVT